MKSVGELYARQRDDDAALLDQAEDVWTVTECRMHGCAGPRFLNPHEII
jgi:hypothetical protein